MNSLYGLRRYREIPIISPELLFFVPRLFWWACFREDLFSGEELIFGGIFVLKHVSPHIWKPGILRLKMRGYASKNAEPKGLCG